MWPAWTNMLLPWQWLVLLAVPPALVALYFLRLKRQPVEVSSTYLWWRSIEDLHVNSLWQRLRQSLLLFLQLVLVALLMLALLRPNWKTDELTGGRYVFLIDTSASMAATDVTPTRLEVARRRVEDLIDKMSSGDQAMIISFSDRARVEQSYTDNRKELRQRLAGIGQTAHSTSLSEALHVASGLANPGHSVTDISGPQSSEALPARMFIVSDGKFPDIPDFALGHLKPVFLAIGDHSAENLAITTFDVRSIDRQPDKLQAFARIDSYSRTDRAIDLELFMDDQLIDASQIVVPAGESAGAAFEVDYLPAGVLKLTASTQDGLRMDDTAWCAVNPPRLAKVLLITATPNEPLAFALTTESAAQIADIAVRSADYLNTEEYRQHATAGEFDLIIYDRCRPTAMPQANTLFIGALPPQGWAADGLAEVPQIIDTDRAHPLMQFVEMGDVIISEATPLKPPTGHDVLIRSQVGPLFAIAPRQAFEDAVLGFELYNEHHIATNWSVRLSFPVFVLNLLEYLGGHAQHGDRLTHVRAGQLVPLRVDTPSKEVSVVDPSGSATQVARTASGLFEFSDTERLGIYDVNDTGKRIQRFAVNLFDPRESDIVPRRDQPLYIGHVEVAARTSQETHRYDAWKWIVIVALVVLLLEWYIYNRRVYL